MIQDSLLIILGLLVAVCLLIMLAHRVRVSYPIFLLIAGLILCFIPGIPLVRLEPDMVFLIFLPPLLYAAAWNTPWKDIWKFKWQILLLAVGLVILTSSIVAIVSSALIPGISLSQGFLLGAIVSPPDAVAATSILRKIKIPKSISTILEGESLVNDATSLIVFRFSLAAILTGKFSLIHATGEFFVLTVVGVVIGVVIAHLFYWLHRHLSKSSSIDATLSLIAPYLMYVTAEEFHVSGVMAVVSGGLYLGSRSHIIFSYKTRIRTYSIWQVLVYLLNGIVFILIGFQLPYVIRGLGDTPLSVAIGYGLLISITIILIRMICVFPGIYMTRLLFKSDIESGTKLSRRSVFLIGWSGMRGVVSLASALAIPLMLMDGTSFPNRNLILFITFIVILVTLVGQGLTLPWVIKTLNLKTTSPVRKEGDELEIRIRLAEAALQYMHSHYNKKMEHFEAYIRIRDRYIRMIEISKRKLEHDEKIHETGEYLPQYRKMLLELVDVRRSALEEIRAENKYDERLINNREWQLDLEEARLNEQ